VNRKRSKRKRSCPAYPAHRPTGRWSCASCRHAALSRVAGVLICLYVFRWVPISLGCSPSGDCCAPRFDLRLAWQHDAGCIDRL